MARVQVALAARSRRWSVSPSPARGSASPNAAAASSWRSHPREHLGPGDPGVDPALAQVGRRVVSELAQEPVHLGERLVAPAHGAQGPHPAELDHGEPRPAGRRGV